MSEADTFDLPIYSQDGKPASFKSADDATEALKGSGYRVEGGRRVNVIGEDGKIGNVATEDLFTAIDQGYRLAPREAVARDELNELQAAERGTVLGKLSAARDIAGWALSRSPVQMGAEYLANKAGITHLPSLTDPLGLAAAKGLAAATGDTATKAYAEGVTGGLTFDLDKGLIRQGLKHAFGKEAGDAYERQQRLLRELHRNEYVKGELAGMIGGGVAGNELLAAGKGLAALGGVASGTAKAGLLAEETAALATRGLSGTLGKEMVASAARLGARGAAEGAIMGATQEISEEMLGDEELAAQKVFASAGHGAFAGLIGGAAMGAAGPLASKAVEGVKGALARRAVAKANNTIDVIDETTGRAAKDPLPVRVAQEQAFRSVDPKLAAQKELTRKGLTSADAGEVMLRTEVIPRNPIEAAKLSAEDLLDRVKTARATVGADIGEIRAAHNVDVSWSAVEAEVKPLIADLRKHASPQHRTAANQLEQFLEDAKAVSGAAERTPKHTIRIDVDAVPETKIPISVEHAPSKPAIDIPISVDGPMRRGPKGKFISGKEEIVERVVPESGGYLDAKGIPRGERGRLMPGNHETEAVIPGLKAREFPYSVGGEEKGVVSLERLVDIRQDLETMFGGWRRELGFKDEQFAMARNAIEDLITKNLDDAAKAIGDPTARARYIAAKRDYKALLTVESAAQRRVEAAAANRAVSPSDYGVGIGAGLGGLILSEAMTGGVGIGLATAVAHKVIRERGNAFAASMLQRINDMGTAYKAVQATNRAMESAADGVVAGALGGSPYRTLAKQAIVQTRRNDVRESIGQRYDRAALAVASMRADPDAPGRIADAATIPGAPKMSNAYASTLVRAAEYLGNKLPPQPASSMPGKETRPDTSTQYRFVKAFDAINDPMSVYRDMSRGKIDLEAIDALKAVRPLEYAELREQVIDRLAKEVTSGKKIPPDRQMKLFLAFDVQLAPTMSPQALFMQHAASAAVNAGSDQPKPQPRPHPAGAGKPPPPAGFDALER